MAYSRLAGREVSTWIILCHLQAGLGKRVLPSDNQPEVPTSRDIHPATSCRQCVDSA